MKLVKGKGSGLVGIDGAIKNKNGPVIVLSKVPTEGLQEVIEACRNEEGISIEVNFDDIKRLKGLGIVLNRQEFNAFFHCQTINEAPPSFLARNGIRAILVGDSENKTVEIMDGMKYGFIYTKLKSLVRDIGRNLPEAEKFKEVYTRLAYMLDYDGQILERGSQYSKENRKASRNLENAVLLNKAVCLGYAETLKQTLSLLGIKSRVVRSMYNEDGQGHAYNVVRINGEWYNADLTWDYSNIRRGIRPRYCLKSDRDFLKCDVFDRPNHKPGQTRNKIPRCRKSLEIYTELEPTPNLVERLNTRVRKNFRVINGGLRKLAVASKGTEFRRHLKVDPSKGSIQHSEGYEGKHFSGKSISTKSTDKDYTK